ncbi:MAG: DUF1127 domain-containing protein [Pseudomonadota bacterium]|nr:DUF1127 domain-containing protein [Pseudomonadota bacterium]
MSTIASPRRWLSATASSNRFAFAALMVARRFRRRVRIWEDRRKLQALPDHLLADIGISRSEIERVTDFGRGDPVGRLCRF